VELVRRRDDVSALLLAAWLDSMVATKAIASCR